MDSGEDVAAADEIASARPRFERTRLVIVALAIILAAVLFARLVLHWPDGGKYPLLDHDNDDLMISDAPNANRTLTVMFVGNSLTFVNDLPAMLVNLASSDPGATTRLEVKAVTRPSASLDEIRATTDGLAWVQSHHVDDVVLQERSYWYNSRNGFDASSDGYDNGVRAAEAWTDALRPTGATPLIFEVWADAEGSQIYADHDYTAFGSTPGREAANALQSTQSLASRVGASFVPVGEKFEIARQTPGAPDVWGPDRHHPSVAGTYLAALLFYRQFTGRTGAETTWRPYGLSVEDAAKLQSIAGS